MSSAAARLSGTCGVSRSATGGQAGGAEPAGAAGGGDTGCSGAFGRVEYGGVDCTGGAEIGGTGGAETGGTNDVRPWFSGLAGSWRGIAGPRPSLVSVPLRR